ncbi:MAG: ATP/GTP-binding protein [Nitrososphaerota archaeon]
MRTIFIVGTAGSGKSTFTASFSEWLKDNEQTVATVNLDPAAISLPYEPDIDVRDIVDYERIMATRGLGPNAALIASVREVAKNIELLSDQLKELDLDYALIDTPGQLELFAFRKEGKIIAKELSIDRSALIYLVDPTLALTTKNFASTLFLATSVYLSFSLPTVLVVSKIDIVPKKYLRRISRWISSEEAFEVEVENKGRGVQMLITREVARLVYEIGQSFPCVMVSAKTLQGMSELHLVTTRILGEGEDEMR